MNVSAPDPAGVVLCNHFIWDFLWFILIGNFVVLLATIVILKSSPLEPFRMRYFVVRFDEKYGYLCAYHQSKIKCIQQPKEQKSGRRVTQCSNTLCGGYCFQPIKSSPLEPFRIRYFVVHFGEKYGYLCAYHSSKIKFTLQPQKQKSGRRVTQCSNTLCDGYCTQTK